MTDTPMPPMPIEDEFFTEQHRRLGEGTRMIRALGRRMADGTVVDWVCPRCGGGVPTDEQRGEYPGALSRTDNLTEICSACGQREAFEQMRGAMFLASQADWLYPPAPGANAGSGKSTSGA